MVCPVDGCGYYGGGPMEGTVPGVKRHVKYVHGPDVYAKVQWPPIYRHGTSVYGDRLRNDGRSLQTYTFRELRVMARKRGVPQFGKNKADLIRDLS
jgi:hypothetical protein